MRNSISKINRVHAFVIVCMLLLGIEQPVCAQNNSPATKLEIEWHVYQNNYDGKDQTLWSFIIANKAQTIVPKTGWKIYFNYGKRITAVTGTENLQVTHVNGGLFYISPGKDFKKLEANNGKIEQKFTANSWVVNHSDAPQGFYLVWDSNPKVAIPLSAIKINIEKGRSALQRFPGDKELTSAALYDLNQWTVNQLVSAPRIFFSPAVYLESKGDFRLDQVRSINSDPQFNNEASLFAEDLKALVKKTFSIKSKGNVKGNIWLKKDTSISDGSYKLSVSSSGIIISASGAREIHYGLQSLKTLLNPQGDNNKNVLLVKCVEVMDQPRFKFRGVMLDVARNFQSKKEVMKLIDLLSLYKFTTLHLHLNDDEAWRLEIKKLPELTSIGANRGHDLSEKNSLMPAYGSGPESGKLPGSGYYSRADFIEILRYASRRHINIIPEVETPGHARAAIVSMQTRYRNFMKLGDTASANAYLLRDLADSSVYRSVQQWNDHVMDVSKPSVYHFLETVTDEIIELYKLAGAPLQTIHFGGDEVPVGVWTKSPSVNLLKLNHPEIKDQSDLWDYYFGRVANMLKQRNLYVSGWEETAFRKSTVPGEKKWQPNPVFLNRNFHVNVWNNMSGNEDLAYRLANSGYKVILSFVTNFYFDMAYKRQLNEPGEQSFKFIPFNYLHNQPTDYVNRPMSKAMLQKFQPLTETGKANILGIQGLLWTETVQCPERMEYMYLPRILALAERAWGKNPDWAISTDSVKASLLYRQDWSRFVFAIGRELNRLDYYAGGFNYRIPQPAVRISNGMAAVNTDIPGFEIRYTQDGSLPSSKSSLYLNPVPWTKQLRFRAFNGGNVVDNESIENEFN